MKLKKSRLAPPMFLATMILAPAMWAPQLEHSRSVLRAQDAEVEASGAQLVAKFVAALRNGDEAQRLQASLPLLHRSLLTAAGDDIDPSVKKVAWKKAVANAPGLELPVRVVRVRSKGNLTIGEGSKKVERGRVDDYFLARSDKDALPARVTLFFPEDGEPRVYDLSGV